MLKDKVCNFTMKLVDDFFYLESKDLYHFCPRCNKKLIKKGWQKRKIYEDKEGNGIISKNYLVQKYRCNSCRKYFTLTPYEWLPNKRYTLQIIEDILNSYDYKNSNYDSKQITRLRKWLTKYVTMIENINLTKCDDVRNINYRYCIKYLTDKVGNQEGWLLKYMISTYNKR